VGRTKKAPQAPFLLHARQRSTLALRIGRPDASKSEVKKTSSILEEGVHNIHLYYFGHGFNQSDSSGGPSVSFFLLTSDGTELNIEAI
jgi:hypothetical protein